MLNRPTAAELTRRLPIGAECCTGGVHLRVWAPKRTIVEVAREGNLEDRADKPNFVPLQSEANGYFSGLVPEMDAGDLYRFRLDGDSYLYPDPVSRFQPDGPHGPSCIVDPSSFVWHDGNWRGRSLPESVIYEMHVGTFTPEGTWQAAKAQLQELKNIGITMLEIMPVADFPGRFGWGYDGVDLFAPTHLYGSPEDFRSFVDAAHTIGLAVLLDVVYNHLGPDGNYLGQFSDDYHTKRYKTEWGDPINFDGENAGPVREFFISNAGYWIDEFHLDGLRLDATQNIYDSSSTHILSEIGRQVRACAKGKSTVIVAENEPQHTFLVRPLDSGGYGLDGLWNDDFHHSAMVALTGHNEAYYTDYLGRPQEFISSLKYGYLYQGQYYTWQEKRRGTPALDIPPAAFVLYLQNHDQISNLARAFRIDKLSSPGRLRALTALLLLAPGTPMLFQGQEFGASAPFYYFADHAKELSSLVAKGRAEFVAQFRSAETPEIQDILYDPSDERTFLASKMDFHERVTHREVYDLPKDLLKLRQEITHFTRQTRGHMDGAVLDDNAFVLRFFDENFSGDEYLLVVNLGIDLKLSPAPEPLLAPPDGRMWTLHWSSEDPKYGGSGTPRFNSEMGNWTIMGQSAAVYSTVKGDPYPVFNPEAFQVPKSIKDNG